MLEALPCLWLFMQSVRKNSWWTRLCGSASDHSNLNVGWRKNVTGSQYPGKEKSVGSLTGDWQWVVTVDFAGYLLSFCESSGLFLLDHRLRLPCMQDRCLICGYQQESCPRWMLNCSDLLKLRNFWAQLKIQHELPQEHWCLRLWCLQIFRCPWFHEEMGKNQWLDVWLIAGSEQSAVLSWNPIRVWFGLQLKKDRKELQQV